MMTKNYSKKIVFSFRSRSVNFHPIAMIFSSREAEFYGPTDQSIRNGLKSVVWSKINLVHWAKPDGEVVFSSREYRNTGTCIAPNRSSRIASAWPLAWQYV